MRLLPPTRASVCAPRDAQAIHHLVTFNNALNGLMAALMISLLHTRERASSTTSILKLADFNASSIGPKAGCASMEIVPSPPALTSPGPSKVAPMVIVPSATRELAQFFNKNFPIAQSVLQCNCQSIICQTFFQLVCGALRLPRFDQDNRNLCASAFLWITGGSERKSFVHVHLHQSSAHHFYARQINPRAMCQAW